MAVDRGPCPSARLIAAEIAAGDRTCVAVAEAALVRIEATSDLRAFLAVNPALLDDARRLDAARADGMVGPLHGVPVAIKDNVETRDMPTTAGAVALRGLRTGRDAAVVARLRAAGALIVGKTNLDELAIAGRGDSGLGGQMRHPLDRSRHPGGSSGGSALALLFGAAALAVGTETVNSLRLPASATGTVAIHPAREAVPRTGVVPQSPLTDVVGPMARDVRDAALLLPIMAGHPPLGPPGPLDPARVRIGVPRSMFGDRPEHAGVNGAVEAALDAARAAGAAVIPIDDDTLATAPLYERLAVQVHEVADAFAAYMIEIADLPSAQVPIGVRTLADILRHGPHAPLVRPFVEAALAGAAADRAKAISAHQEAVREVEQSLRAHFAIQALDVVVYPLCHRPAARPIGEPSRPERNGVLAAALGWPAVNLPVGTVWEAGASSALPVGLDVLAPPGAEERLIEIASWIEGWVPDSCRG